MDTQAGNQVGNQVSAARRVSGYALLVVGLALVGLVWAVSFGFQEEYGVLGRGPFVTLGQSLLFGVPFLAIPALALVAAWALHRRLAAVVLVVAALAVVGVAVAGSLGVRAKASAYPLTATCQDQRLEDALDSVDHPERLDASGGDTSATECTIALGGPTVLGEALGWYSGELERRGWTVTERTESHVTAVRGGVELTVHSAPPPREGAVRITAHLR